MKTNVRVGDTVTMTSFDPYGFCGRELHPEESDLGCVGKVLSIEKFNDDEVWEVESAPVGDAAEADALLTVAVESFEVRFLELMDFEVNSLS
jgi:hypothetical protein